MASRSHNWCPPTCPFSPLFLSLSLSLPPSPPWAHCCLQQLLDFTYLGSPLACCLSTSLVELLGKLEPLTPAPPPKENHPPGYRHAPPPQKNPFCVCSLPQLEVHVLHKSDCGFCQNKTLNVMEENSPTNSPNLNTPFSLFYFQHYILITTFLPSLFSLKVLPSTPLLIWVLLHKPIAVGHT